MRNRPSYPISGLMLPAHPENHVRRRGMLRRQAAVANWADEAPAPVLDAAGLEFRRSGSSGEAGDLDRHPHVAARGTVVDALERRDVRVVAAAGDDDVALADRRAARRVEGDP